MHGILTFPTAFSSGLGLHPFIHVASLTSLESLDLNDEQLFTRESPTSHTASDAEHIDPMDSSDQAPLQAEMQQLPDGTAGAMELDPNNLAQMSGVLNNQLDPNTISIMMANPSLIPDPSLMGLPLQDPSLMMNPLLMANGHAAALPPQPNGGISAGKSMFSSPSQLNRTRTDIASEEIALYDRQIRLWGMAAQAKIQSANVLLITMRALANEIAKNLVLAGIGSLTILDDATITELDLGAQFFLREDANVIGQNRAQAASVALQELNPRVKIHVDTDGAKLKGPSYFGSFDIVIATDLDPDTFHLINTSTRLHGKAFYAAGTHGMYGYIFSDLIEHDYVIQRDQGNMPTTPKQETRTRSIVNVTTKKEGGKIIESVTKRELYSTWFLASDLATLPEEYTKSKRRLKSVTPALSCLRALWEFMQLQGGRVPSTSDDLKLFTQVAMQKHKALGLPGETLKPEFLRSFLQNLGSEIAPVTAILGGQLAQDVINVLGQTQQPIQNMVIFDGTTMEALMYPLHPEGSLGANLLSSGEPMVTNGGGMMIPPMNGLAGMPLDVNAMAMLPQQNNIAIPGGLPHEAMALGTIPLQDPIAQPVPQQVPQPPNPEPTPAATEQPSGENAAAPSGQASS